MAIASPVEVAAWRTMDEAAAQLRLSRRTITRWVAEGHIRVYKVPGDRHRYVDLDEIRKFRTPTLIEPKEKG
jgi:excisionase family DNA binding protein